MPMVSLWWAGPDSDRRPSARQADVLTRLDDRPTYLMFFTVFSYSGASSFRLYCIFKIPACINLFLKLSGIELYSLTVIYDNSSFKGLNLYMSNKRDALWRPTKCFLYLLISLTRT